MNIEKSPIPTIERVIDPENKNFLASHFPEALEKLIEVAEKRPFEEFEGLMRQLNNFISQCQKLEKNLITALEGQNQNGEIDHVIRSALNKAVKWLLQYRSELPEDDFYRTLNSEVDFYRIHTELIFHYLSQNPKTLDDFIRHQRFLEPFFHENYPDHDRDADDTILSQENMSRGQQSIMEKIDLRDYESETTNTEIVLEHLLRNLLIRNSATDFKEYIGDRNPFTVLDLGCGNLRLDIPLALAGFKVEGVDISEHSLIAGETRLDSITSGTEDRIISDYQKAIRNLDPFLANELKRQQADISKLKTRIKTAKEDFFHLDAKRKKELFETGQVEFVTIMWHTFCFAGNREGQKQVLQNAYDNLKPGGTIIIEVPDRNFGVYSRAVRQFDEKTEHKHPFGSVIDAPSAHGEVSDQESEIAVPRYFPSTKEIYQLLAEVGFGNAYNETYFIKTGNSDNQQIIKENLFVAEKEFVADDIDMKQFNLWRLYRSTGPALFQEGQRIDQDVA